MSTSLDGFFNVIKPAGITSFDVIRRIRPHLGKKAKVGHAGVIDKPALGVLPIGVGRATRLFDVLSGFTKDYYSFVAFGVNSPTLDFGSDLSPVSPPNSLDEALTLAQRIISFSTDFQGHIKQIPPAYSNIKIDGRELYKYELDHEKVESSPRIVRINRFEFLGFHYISDGMATEVTDDKLIAKSAGDFGLPSLKMPTDIELPCPILIAELFIECETGTYVRAIARDLGEKAQCGGIVAKLMRTRVGPFSYRDAVDLDTLTDSLKCDLNDTCSKYLLPMSTVIQNESKIRIFVEEAQVLSNGGPIIVQVARLPRSVIESEIDMHEVYAILEDGRLVARCLASERQTQPDVWVVRPDKVFLK